MNQDKETVFPRTIEKLTNIVKSLEDCLETKDWDKAESVLETLREYRNCYYCQAFRKSLDKDGQGYCDGCPCHSLGTTLLGRNRGHNGCYLVKEYREAVRNSHWFAAEQSPETVEACIKSVKDLLSFMEKNKEKLGG